MSNNHKQLPPEPSESNVLTITMQGTGYHRTTFQSLQTSLDESIKITPNQTTHLIDGPGGAGNEQDPLLGLYDFSCEYKPGSGIIEITKTPHHDIKIPAQLFAGNVKGSGYEEAIDESAEIIRKMLDNNVIKPFRLNLTGFSRGADTMLRLSNVLNAMYSKEELVINLFLVDPVPGTGRQASKKARIVPEIVDQCVVIGMRDEGRFILGWQGMNLSVQDPENTSVSYHLYHGQHASGTYVDPKKPDTHATPRLVRDDLLRFLEKTDIKFNNPDYPVPLIYEVIDNKGETKYTTVTDDLYTGGRLENHERLVLYTNMLLKKGMYTKDGTAGVRDFTHHQADFCLHGIGYFLDRQHMELFREQYPAFFDFVFQQNRENKPDTDVTTEITKMPTDLKTTLLPYINSELKKNGEVEIANLMDVSRNIKLGIHLIAKEFYTKHNQLLKLWNGIVSITNAVRAGFDESIQPRLANRFYDMIHEVLISDKPEIEKLRMVKDDIASFIIQYPSGGNYIFKLATLLDKNHADMYVANVYLNQVLKLSQSNTSDFIKTDKQKINKAMNDFNQNPENKKPIINIMNQLCSRSDNNVRPKINQLINGFKKFNIPNKHPDIKITHSMDRYLNRFEWYGIGRNTKLTAAKKAIAAEVINIIKEIKKAGFATHSDVINRVLGIALRMSGQLRTRKGYCHRAEGELDDRLRQGIIDISTNYSPARTKEENDKISQILKNFETKITSRHEFINFIKIRDSSSPKNDKTHPVNSPPPSLR